MNAQLLMVIGMVGFTLFTIHGVFAESDEISLSELKPPISHLQGDNPSFVRQDLQTGGEISFSGTFVSMLVGSLGSVLIVLFIVIFAVKKRMKNRVEEKK